jgi:hypothetical protein
MLQVLRRSNNGIFSSFDTETTKTELTSCLERTIELPKESCIFAEMQKSGLSRKTFAEGKTVLLNIWSKDVSLYANDFEIIKHDKEQSKEGAIVLNLFNDSSEMWFLDPRPGMIRDNKKCTVYYFRNNDMEDVIVCPQTLKCSVMKITEDGKQITKNLEYLKQGYRFQENGELLFDSSYPTDHNDMLMNNDIEVLNVYMSKDNKKIMFEVKHFEKKDDIVKTCFVEMF